MSSSELTHIGKYQIIREIGKGAFARVYLARHPDLDAPRALKVLHRNAPGVGSTDYNLYRQRFQLEAQLGARIEHPNVIRVYDAEQTAESLVLVTEYAAGGSLQELVRRNQAEQHPLPVEQAVKLARDIAEGLSAIHKLDVVHRDLKPSNILLDAQGTAKVADLGLAQVSGGPSQRSELGSEAGYHPGTPAYMSPEQTTTMTYLTPASDVYALGNILFEMLTNRQYKNVKPGTRARALHRQVPVWLDELVAQMLADDPRKRPWDGAEVAQILRARSAKTHIGFPKELSKIPMAGVAGVAVILFLIVGAAWLWRGCATIQPPSAGDTQARVVATATLMPTLAPATTVLPTATLIPATATRAPATVTPAPPTPMPTNTPTIVPPTRTPLPANTATPRAGDTRAFAPDNAPMQFVPAGEFTMGSNDGNSNEQPVHSVYLNAFWMDKYEVTNRLYKMCTETRRCSPPSETGAPNGIDLYFGNSQYNDFPVVNVNREQAKTYCEWAGKRLSTEAEWEKAARGTDGRVYPWGNTFDKNQLNSNEGNKGNTTAVGSYMTGASPYEIMDLAGNVWEWVADWYGAYPNDLQRVPSGPSSGSSAVFRGGSYRSMWNNQRTTNRAYNSPTSSYYDVGFRCARSE